MGKNIPAHDETMMRLVAWIHAHDTDGIVYGGDKAALALGKGFVAGQTLPSQMDLRP